MLQLPCPVMEVTTQAVSIPHPATMFASIPPSRPYPDTSWLELQFSRNVRNVRLSVSSRIPTSNPAPSDVP